MSKHPLWVQWQSTLDTWMSSNLTKSEPLSDSIFSFYSRSTNSFQFLIENNRIKSIKKSLLTISTQTPNVSFSAIAKYLSKNPESQIKLATIINFNSFFMKLFQPINDINEYKSLCLIILSMLNYNSSLIYQAKKESNVVSLYDKTFDITLDDETRTLIVAIIYQILPNYLSLKSLISDESFFNDLKKAIPTSSPQHLQWLIFLISRSFKNSYIEKHMFYESSIHFQLCELIYHKSSHLRASIMNSLYYFLQPNDETTNLYILLMSLPSFMDVSYIVRYQLLLFLSNYLSSNFDQFICYYNKYPKLMSFISFSELLSSWMNFSINFTNIEIAFTNFLKNIDKQIHSDNFLGVIYNSIFSIIDYFTHDPFPKIHQHAKSIKQYFLKLIQEKQISSDDSKSSSLNKFSSPSNSLIQSNELSINYNNSATQAFEDDSNTDQILTKSTINNIESNNKRTVKKSQHLQKYGNIDISLVNINPKFSVQLDSIPTKIGFESSNLCTAVSMINNTINYYDEKLVLLNRIKTDGGEITDLHILDYNQENFVISCTARGYLNIWNPVNKYCSVSFRADSNYCCDSIQQFAAVSSNYSNIATIRGNCALALWDIESQKLVGEWNSSGRNISTSLTFHPSDKNRLYVGYSDGSIIEIDTRISSMTNSSKFTSVTLGEKIVDIGVNMNDGEFIFAASNSKCSIINTKTKSISNLLTFQNHISKFAAHATIPLIALTRQKDVLSIYNRKGQLLHQLKNVGSEGIYKFNSISPVLNVAVNDELTSYNFKIS